MKTGKPIKLILAAIAATAIPVAAVACAGSDDASKTYTITFETNGGTEYAPITAINGSMIFAPADPARSGFTFGGWYTSADFSGDSVVLPKVMPDKNVTYYAKFDPIAGNCTVTYNYNLGKAPHKANIPAQSVAPGEAVTIADGNKYQPDGYKFMGWSTSLMGTVSLTDKKDGEYEVGEQLTVTENITLYAQWAVGYTDSRKASDDIIYVYMPLADQGKGAVILSRKDKDDLLGFLESDNSTTSGEYEFTFYADEFEESGGEYNGRLYGDFTYALSDGYNGQFLNYDYVTEGPHKNGYVLAMDGFGFATITQRAGSQVVVRASGNYELDPEYGDYKFTYKSDTAAADADPEYMYFSAEIGEVTAPNGDATQFKGYFTIQGLESGAFYGYNNEVDDLENYTIELNGYGTAIYTEYVDIYANTLKATKTVEGKYVGTADYESYMGEWQFIPTATADAAYACKFVVDVAYAPDEQGGAHAIPIVIKYDATKAGTYTLDEGGDKTSTLYLDGYGSALYTDAVNKMEYVGECTVSGDSVTFTPHIEQADGSVVLGGTIAFTIDRQAGTFARAVGGFNTTTDQDSSKVTLTSYTGATSVVEIPDEVNIISENAFNYVYTNVSLVSVTIPQDVESIGVKAFQNNYTLRRAIFLSATPIEIDFSTENDPFRWGAGDFVIVVPEAAKEAYIAAWTDCPYTIMGSEEVLIQPEFVIEDGVLVRYNKPEDAGELVDVVIPPEVTEIADSVFLGLSFVKSVNLNNVTKVGANAFYGCVNLETVLMPEVTELGEMAFGACYNLNNSGTKDVLELLKIETIGAYAFSGCESLRLVKLGANLTSIGDLAFYECNIYEEDPPLMVRLLGDTPPQMGSKVTTGNIAFRFWVNDISVALKCYKNTEQWNSYCRHLYIESGDEKGEYISGADMLVLDGRAVYQSNYVWLYAIDGNKIKFYEYSELYQDYTAIEGTYQNGTIVLEIQRVKRTFVLVEEQMTYITADGKNTLTCNPEDLQPESYDGYKGDADVTFNGKPAKLHIVGFNSKIIYGYDEGGTLYDIYITFTDGQMSVEKKPSPVRQYLTAADGSQLTLLTDSNGVVYAETASFKISVDTDRYLEWSEASGMGVIATKTSDGVYTFTFRFRTVNYNFTVTVTGEGTFTYTYTKVAME